MESWYVIVFSKIHCVTITVEMSIAHNIGWISSGIHSFYCWVWAAWINLIKLLVFGFMYFWRFFCAQKLLFPSNCILRCLVIPKKLMWLLTETIDDIISFATEHLFLERPNSLRVVQPTSIDYHWHDLNKSVAQSICENINTFRRLSFTYF